MTVMLFSRERRAQIRAVYDALPASPDRNLIQELLDHADEIESERDNACIDHSDEMQMRAHDNDVNRAEIARLRDENASVKARCTRLQGMLERSQQHAANQREELGKLNAEIERLRARRDESGQEKLPPG